MKWTGGIPKSEHSRLHRRIIRKHGRAKFCQADNCTKKSKRFEWALLKGREYSDNPSDYIQLCVSCHRKYDFNEGIRQKLSEKKLGEKHNFAKLTESNVLEIYRLLNKGVQSLKIAKKFNVNPSTISDIKRGKRWPHTYHHYKPLPQPPKQ